MVRTFTFCAFLIQQILLGNSARILGIAPWPSYSHQVLFRPIWNELSKRGHELVVLTTDPQEISWQKNFRQIDLSGAYQILNTSITSKMTGMSIYGDSKDMREVVKMVEDIEKYEMEHPEVQEMIKNKTEHFDLLIIEHILPITAAFSVRFDCPYIGVVSHDALTVHHNYMGNPTHPVLYPYFRLPFVPPLNFFQRIISVLNNLIFVISYEYLYMPKINLKVKRYFGEQYPDISDISHNISMLFVNTNLAFSAIKPLVPATVQIGGGTHIGLPKQLPEHLKSFLDEAKQGVIYFSLGTNVKSNVIGESLPEVFLNTFRNLPYKVLWKFDGDLENVPDNVKVVKWLPQQDVLRHPNIILFIMQGGLQSTEEAVLNHVPLIVIPFFSDQPGNGLVAKSKGFGIVLDKEELNPEMLKSAIVEVISNPKYKEAVIKTASILTDQPMTGTEKAVWWSEYVIRHKGAHHLKSNAADIPLYQYFLLDVIAALVVTALSAGFIVYKSVKWILSKIYNSVRIKYKSQ